MSDKLRICGECTLCCSLLAVPPLNKPENTPCRFCNEQAGCKIYADRPAICRSFDCLWLQSLVLPDEFRPDRCGVMFDAYHPEKTVVAISAKPLAWTRTAITHLIHRMLMDNYAVWIIDGSARHVMLPTHDTEERALARAKAAWRRIFDRT